MSSAGKAAGCLASGVSYGAQGAALGAGSGAAAAGVGAAAGAAVGAVAGGLYGCFVAPDSELTDAVNKALRLASSAWSGARRAGRFLGRLVGGRRSSSGQRTPTLDEATGALMEALEAGEELGEVEARRLLHKGVRRSYYGPGGEGMDAGGLFHLWLRFYVYHRVYSPDFVSASIPWRYTTTWKRVVDYLVAAPAGLEVEAWPLYAQASGDELRAELRAELDTKNNDKRSGRAQLALLLLSELDDGLDDDTDTAS